MMSNASSLRRSSTILTESAPMAEIRLQARSPFAGLLKPGRHGAHNGAAGVTLSERTGLALFVISAGAGKAKRGCREGAVGHRA